jgi:two-component system response regulator RegX3
MKARVLIIEDERELAELILMYLQRDGIVSQIAGSAEEGIEKLSRESFDLIILDLNLPGMDGFEFLQHARPGTKTPIIIVSAREADEDIIMGLGIGADEFVMKPFKPKVLVARIRALLRRSRTDERRIVAFGPFVLDVDGYFLSKSEQRVPVSTKEFEILRHLALNPGRAMTPDDIYEEIWGNRHGDRTSVAVYIRRLRQKLEDDPGKPVYIQTIHGKGYRFNPGMIESRA